MGYSMYSNKNFIRTSDGRVLPLCQYADSRTYDTNGKHPKSWCILLRSDENHLLDKDFEKCRADIIERHLSMYRELADAPNADLDYDNYYGDTYNGNRKIRGMKSFYSAVHAKPFSEFITQKNLYLTIYIYENNKLAKKVREHISSEQMLYEMDELFATEKKKGNSVSVGIDLF